MKTLEDKIAVMQAFAEGKTIMQRGISYAAEKWEKVDNPGWDWSNYDYKIKKEQKEGWINIYSGNRTCVIIYPTLQEAERRASEGLLKSARVEWEE